MLQSKNMPVKQDKQKPALLFLPRIRGFSKLVTETDIEHSQHIISELLEVIIHSNTIGLQISEIEDNAILFFHDDDIPDFSSLTDQLKKMYLNFHQRVQQIEADSICQCGACSTVNKLHLRFILHAGIFTVSQIGKHCKLIGGDVILIHRLLNNSIPINEYALFTEGLNTHDQKSSDTIDALTGMAEGSEHYDHIGKVNYQFLPISDWLKEIPPMTPSAEIEVYGESITAKIDIDASLNDVFATITDVQQRKDWMHGVKAIEYQGEAILRLGAKHVCDLNMGKMTLQTERFEHHAHQRKYAEKVLHSRLFKKANLIFDLTETKQGTHIELNFNFDLPGIKGKITLPVIRKIVGAMFRNSLRNLKTLCESKTRKPI